MKVWLIRNCFVFLSLFFSSLILCIVDPADLARTIFALYLVTLLGVWQCRATFLTCRDPKLSVLELIWLVKIPLTLVLIIGGWLKDISLPENLFFAYDPKGYFYNAMLLVENGWKPTVGLNSTGILYYYGFIFFIISHNPFAPALINIFISLAVILFTIRSLYVNQKLNSRYWTICSLLVIPELLWFDAITAREGICTAMILLAVVSLRNLFYSKSSLSYQIIFAGLAALSSLMVLLLRGPLILPIALLVVIALFFLRSSLKHRFVVMVTVSFIAIGFVALRPTILVKTMSVPSSWGATLQTLTAFDNNYAAKDSSWSNSSIGRLIAPNNIYQAIAFIPPRMFVYLVAPLPNIPINMKLIHENRYSLWQNICAVLTGAIEIALFPFCLTGLLLAIKARRDDPASLFMHLSFWLVWAAIAGGNMIILERYRLMMVPLLFISAWLGYISGNTRLIKICSISWIGVCTLGTGFWLVYKFFH